METTAQAAPAGLILGAGDVRIWGMSAAERLRRIFRRVGVAAADEAPGAGTVVIALGGWVYDESLIRTLAGRPGSVLLTDDGQAVAAHVPAARAAEAAAALGQGADPGGLTRLSLAELSYNQELRKREDPILLELTRDNVRAVEARTFKGSYKGVTDLVTKHVWPVPARIVTRWCAQARLTPNMVTFVGFLGVLGAQYFFWNGAFGLGLICAWIMTFLDTVDGKLARVTMTSSKIGNVFDHGIDLIHPPFWWWAWYVGAFHLGNPPPASWYVQWIHLTPLPMAELALAVILIGYVVQRVEEGIFMRAFGMHVHAWRPFDSFFRQITARRNPNLLILTPAWALGAPQLGFYLVAIWTAVSLVVHTAQLVQAFATPRERVVSWLSR
ncbi:CDP-alcohol phosphatidyltransferase family protein [Phenylobacterium sp.]|uniref:CDP-alcohol phosphatidyltransferase family protein n=1 Tax=Phenylobacterium sp. TaxID=1871053 RepID=UPI0025D7DCFC|nr:CDP-alcohol phosphatidyltransferase family protein [Phenylobacterium sp.]